MRPARWRQPFEKFNARYMTPSEVARTFVPPDAYFRLVQGNHSVVSGPRGSGKTTLLKMLTIEGLASWEHRKRDSVLQEMDFLSIFVASDILWSGQAKTLLRSIPDETASLAIRRDLFRIHVCLSCIDTLDAARKAHDGSDPHLRRLGVRLSDEQETTLVRAISDSWKLSPRVASLLGLRAALRGEIASIEVYANRLGDKDARPGTKLEKPASMGVTWLSALTSFIDLTNELLQQKDKKWALLVDELEITFPEIREETFAALRSTHHNLYLKLALFPYESSATLGSMESGPATKGDYNSIKLWYPSKEKSYPFCHQLFQMLVTDIPGLSVLGVDAVFGPSNFDGGRAHRATKPSPYSVGGAIHRRLVSLAKKDPSFTEYLSQKGIKLDGMDKLSEQEKASKVRKVLPIAVIRDEYLREAGVETEQSEEHGSYFRRLKSTGSLSIYTGGYALFALSEGNPRTLLNLVGPLLAEIQPNESRLPVSVKAQSEQIRSVIQGLNASIAGTPYSTVGEDNVLAFVDRVGRGLKALALGERFDPDLAVSFTLDDRIGDAEIDILGRAVNLGAVIPIDGAAGDAVIRSLRRLRYRLAFTFAPAFRLPLVVTGRDASLFALLKAGERRRPSDSDPARKGAQLGLNLND